MDPVVLGISGSAVPNNNTDRAAKGVLEASGLEFEFIKLTEIICFQFHTKESFEHEINPKKIF